MTITSHHIVRNLAGARAEEIRRDSRPAGRRSRARRRHDAAVQEPAGLGARTTERPGGEEEIVRLVSSAAAGDPEAWGALVHAFSGLVARIARAHRLGDADAADVAQATWMKLFEHLGRLEDPACVGSWVATTARRECLHTLRHARRVVSFVEDWPEPASTDLAPGESLLVLEREQAVRRSFAQLGPRDQLLLGLLTADPRPPYEEISAALRMPIGSIGPTRARALERLRAELDRDGALTLLAG